MPSTVEVPIYFLAFDHRVSLTQGLLGVTSALEPADRAWIESAKLLVLDALSMAVSRGVAREAAAFLVDEEFGSKAARTARARGITLAMPVEQSGKTELALEYGAAYAEHIDRFRPDYVKVLLRRNPDGSPEVHTRENGLLRSIERSVRDRPSKWLVELVVPPTGPQLASVASSQDRFDREIRADLIVRVISDLQAAGVEPDLWKVDGLDDRADCERVAASVRRDGREHVRCVVLGRAAGMDRVLHWLATAGSVDGYQGFAVGRTLWWEQLKAMRSQALDRASAVSQIADNYMRAVVAFEQARTSRRDVAAH